jgi:hypothetical protein
MLNAKSDGNAVGPVQTSTARVKLPIAPPAPALFCMNSTSPPESATTALKVSPVFSDIVAEQSELTL